MSEKTPKALRAKLELKQKKLDLILAIDHIRDTVTEPPAMLAAIANTLTNQLQADLVGDDQRASADYRRMVCPILVERALKEVLS